MTNEDRAAVATRAAALLADKIKPRWQPQPHQIPPSGDWKGWLLMAGRGAGKSKACSEYVRRHVAGPPCLPGPVPHWIAIIAPTLGDGVTSMYEGPGGIRNADPGARLVQAPGGTVIKWPNGSQAKLFGSHTPEDVERLRAGGNTCVREGTLIRTETGLRPIEEIATGDRVWTRNGLRRVLRVWDNGIKEVRRYNHEAGHVWLTPDHEVWTASGWKQASFVQTSDTVFTWESTESRSITQAFTGISGRTVTTRTSTAGYYTGTCGQKPTGRSPQECTCTTRTTSSQTTGLRTSRSSGESNTLLNMRSIETPRGTAREDAPRGVALNTRTTYASSADRHSSPARAQSYRSTAQTDAGESRLVLVHERNGCAACAAHSSPASSSTPPAPVRAGALRSTPTRSVARVYDLTVEHDHEFFAGDLLVANCLAVLEEFATWRYMKQSYDQLRFGLRSGPRPHWIAATTPKPVPLLKDMLDGKIRGIVHTHATMYDNPHLEQSVKDSLEEAYQGTDIGAQELYGRMIDEVSEALWSRATLEATRIRPDEVPDLQHVSVGVDPSGGAGEQGIVVVGKSGLIVPDGGGTGRHHGFVLDDRSCNLAPDQWGKRAVQAAIDWDADDLVVETNYGGAMAVATLRTAAEALEVDIPIRIVNASRGKTVRAQPVAALASQGRWHMAGTFPKLEDQLATWYAELGWSPDRLDAMVWPGWHMKLVGTAIGGRGSMGSGMAGRSILGRPVR